MLHMNHIDASNLPPNPSFVPLMTRAAFALSVGLPLGVLVAQCEKGYWPLVHIGKRVFVNVEAVRLLAAQKAKGFSL